MGNRIYGQHFDINTDNTKKFYDQRAKNALNMECTYTSVLLGDQNPDHATKWNKFEKELIFPQLKITEESNVVDIGCGIGRWSETIIPVSGYYLGTDFSSEMVKLASSRCKFNNRKFDFYNMSFQEISEKNQDFFKCKFNRVLVCGVCMYINDNDLLKCIKGLENLLDEHCIVYLTETVAVETRLTLDNCPSEALKANYDVIYRTPDEYNEYYKLLENKEFKIIKQDFLPHLNNESGFSETDRWYTILER